MKDQKQDQEQGEDREQQWQGLDGLMAVKLGTVRYHCMGRRLMPFTLYHREILRLMGHPLWHQGNNEPSRTRDETTNPRSKVTLADLDLAVRVCSRPVLGSRFSVRGCASKAVRVDIHSDGRKLKRGWWSSWPFALRALRWGRHFDRELNAFRAYLDTCCSTPEVMADAGTGVEKKSPALLDMLSFLSEGGHNIDVVAGEWPAGLSDWMYASGVSRASEGFKFMTDEDVAMQNEIRRQRAELQRWRDEDAAIEESTGLDRAHRVLREVTLDTRCSPPDAGSSQSPPMTDAAG